MRRRVALSRVLVIVASAVGVLAVATTPARAVPPDAHGWWWTAQHEAFPAQLPPPPWVPPDGLYVASNPQGAEAFAAVRFSVPAGATAAALQLAVANARGAPVVGICPNRSSWEPAQGGSIRDAPEFDCAQGVAGAISEDGTTFVFSLAALAGDGDVIDLAIVPLKDNEGGNSTFQIAFEKPGPESLVVTQRPAATASNPTSSGTAETPSAGPSSAATSPQASSPTFDAGPPPAASPIAPASSDEAVAPAVDAMGRPPVLAPPPAPASMSSPGRSADARAKVMAAIILVDCLLVLFWLKRDSEPVRRFGARLAGLDTLPATVDLPRHRGIGDFARPREGPTPPL